jgi:peptide deformylase
MLKSEFRVQISLRTEFNPTSAFRILNSDFSPMVLPIVQYGQPVLRQKGRRVGKVNDAIRTLSANMIETMYHAHGLGLAAQQVGETWRITVIDVRPMATERPSTMTVGGELQDLEKWMPLTLLNPEVTLLADRDLASEGCLSFPDINGDVIRATSVRVKADLLDGRQVEFEAGGMLARAVQHEVDHLNGVLFIDRMNSATRASLKGRLKRLKREQEEAG